MPTLAPQTRAIPYGARPASRAHGPSAISGLVSPGLQGTMIRAEREEQIVAQEDAAGYCYFVLSGCLRTVRLLEDGRRQIGEFLLSGDLFGWEALDTYSFGADAVMPTTLLRYTQFRLKALALCDAGLAERLHALTATQLRANRERVVLLGRKTAAERIATFLLEMASRLPNQLDGSIELPMSRMDVADYLGLTIETVCRGITSLRRKELVATKGPRVLIRDRRALELAGCENPF